MKHPLWRGKGIKPIKLVNTPTGATNVYGALESTSSQKQALLRSPERGLKSISKPKHCTDAGQRVVDRNSISYFSHKLSSFSEIKPVLLFCLCIGASGVWGSMDISQITLPPDAYTESLLQAKETLLQLLQDSSKSSTAEGKLNQIAAETLILNSWNKKK